MLVCVSVLRAHINCMLVILYDHQTTSNDANNGSANMLGHVTQAVLDLQSFTADIDKHSRPPHIKSYSLLGM